MSYEIELTPGGRIPFAYRVIDALVAIHEEFLFMHCDGHTADMMQARFYGYFRSKIASGEFNNIPFRVTASPDEHHIVVRVFDGNGEAIDDFSIFDPDPNEMRV